MAEDLTELRAEVAYWASVAAHGDDVAARLRKELKELRAECVSLPASLIHAKFANTQRSPFAHTRSQSTCTADTL